RSMALLARRRLLAALANSPAMPVRRRRSFGRDLRQFETAQIEVRIGHQMKAHRLHGGVHQFRRNVCIACATAAACSTCGRWPALGIMVSVDPGIRRWTASE